MAIRIRLLRERDVAILSNAAEGVFDGRIEPGLAREFLADPRHHIIVALEDTRVVGFVSAVDYIHPDKPSELWVNEISVAPSHQRAGIAKRLIRAMLDQARARGCRQAWVLTERSNVAALRLYRAVGGVEPLDEVVMFEFELVAEGSTANSDEPTQDGHVDS